MTAISRSTRRRLARRSTTAATLLMLIVTAPTATATSPATSTAGRTAPERAAITAITPARYWDSRVVGATPTVDGRLTASGRIAGGSRAEVPIAGRGEVPSDAVAAVVNLSVIDPESDGSVVVYPCGRRPPPVALVTVAAGETESNSTIVALGGSGDVCVRADATADFALDVTGYVLAGSPISVFGATRIFDTGDGLPTTAFGPRRPPTSAITAGQVVEIDVAGRGRVPTDTAAVFVNVSATASVTDGSASVFACGASPTASTVEFDAGDLASSGTVVSLSPEGTICVSATATADVAVDVVGTIPAGARGLQVAPTTIVAAPFDIGADETIELDIAAAAALPPGVAAAFVTLELAAARGPGDVTLFPCGDRPAVPAAGVGPAARSVTVLTSLSPTGSLCLFSTAAVTVALGLAGLAAGAALGGGPANTDEPDGAGVGSSVAPPTTVVPTTVAGAPTTVGPVVDTPAGPGPTTSPATVPASSSPPPATTIEPATTPAPESVDCGNASTRPIHITGIVHFPDGVPPNQSRFGTDANTRLATLRDHAVEPGSIRAEASVNDAGFFLLNASVPAALGCPRSYTIEIDVELPSGLRMHGELDVTAVMVALTPGADAVEADITSTPIQVEVTERPTPTTAPASTTGAPPTSQVPTSVDPTDNSGEHDTDEPRPDQPPTTTAPPTSDSP